MINIDPHAVALTIAGSDPSGGAGLQADLKTFQQLGVYGMSVVTLITVQNTLAVRRVEVLPPSLLLEQLDAVLADIPPRVIKTGAMGNAEVVQSVGERLKKIECPIVVDPVLVSKHGHLLADDEVVDAYKKYLLPHAWLITPNRFEAERLTGVSLNNSETIAEAIHILKDLGAAHVLIKLGETDGKSRHMFSSKTNNLVLALPRLPEGNTHGAGCVLSAAIAAKVALGENDVEEAVQFGITATWEAIHCNIQLGHGIHPVEIRAIPQAGNE